MKAPSAASPSATPGRGFLTAGWGLALVLACAAVVITWAGRDIAPIGDEWAWIQGPSTWTPTPSSRTTTGICSRRLGAATTRCSTPSGSPVLGLRRDRRGPPSRRRRAGLRPRSPAHRLRAGAPARGGGGVSRHRLGCVPERLNLGLVAAMAACLAALVMLDRRTPRADLAACALLLLGLASFTVAIAFTAGACVEILRRDDRLRRPLGRAGPYGVRRLAARLRRIALRRCTGRELRRWNPRRCRERLRGGNRRRGGCRRRSALQALR